MQRSNERLTLGSSLFSSKTPLKRIKRCNPPDEHNHRKKHFSERKTPIGVQKEEDMTKG